MEKLIKLIEEHKQVTKGFVDTKKYTHYAITHHSTVIEGSTLTESQVVNLLEYGKTAPSKPFEHHQMVHDHYLALIFITQKAEKKQELTSTFLQDIAAKVMKNTGGFINTALGTYDISKGDFRKGSVRAGNRAFPAHNKVQELTANLISELNNGMIKAKTLQQKCELAFYAHFKLVSIHPFGDGNGRTSRLLMNYIQAYFDLPLSIIYKQDRIKYIDALELCRKKKDIKIIYKFMFSQYQKFLKAEIKLAKK